MRFFLELSYKGTHYHGWQIQPNAITVQEKIESALTILLNIPTRTMGAGRTDSGVHALQMFAHFDTEKELDLADFTYRMNALLPDDIAIQKTHLVALDAHSRFNAKQRTYQYHLSKTKSPFKQEFSWWVKQKLDIKAMNTAAEQLLNYTDFTSFSKLHTDVKTNNCDIRLAKWEANENEWVFTISADRFLRNMVRAIVGTLVDIGKGKTNLEEFCQLIEKKDRHLAGASAPAEGLFLTQITYPKGIFTP